MHPYHYISHSESITHLIRPPAGHPPKPTFLPPFPTPFTATFPAAQQSPIIKQPPKIKRSPETHGALQHLYPLD